MSPTPSRALRRTVGAVKLGVAVTVTFLATGPLLGATQDTGPDRVRDTTVVDSTAPGGPQQELQASLDALIAKHHCSPHGFGPEVIPGSALVERDDRVQRVTFDDGWATFRGTAPGALLAVCRTVL